MCRLFGYVNQSTCSVADLLGDEGLDAFTSLTAVHSDGWGMAWRTPDGRTETMTSPGAANEDETYDELAHTPLSSAGMVHLRWATGGLPVRPENTHPFSDGTNAFAHNGHVSPISRLEDLLHEDTRATLEGDTDSERYFRFVRQCIDEHDDEEAGVTEALAIMIKHFPECSLNALMLTPTKMYAIHINSRADSPLRALRAMFDDEDEIPDRHTTEYFAMDYRVSEDSIQVVSSGLDEPGWTPVPSDTAVMVDLVTREVTRLDPVAALDQHTP